jgi:hypothetical protein
MAILRKKPREGFADAGAVSGVLCAVKQSILGASEDIGWDMRRSTEEHWR